ELALDDQRTRQLERLGHVRCGGECLLESGERGRVLAPGGADQGAATGGRNGRRRSLKSVCAFFERGRETVGALEVAEVDECLDRVRQERSARRLDHTILLNELDRVCKRLGERLV